MLLLNQITKSVGVCNVFKPGNASWLGGLFGSPDDAFRDDKKTHTSRIKADSFDFKDNFKVL